MSVKIGLISVKDQLTLVKHRLIFFWGITSQVSVLMTEYLAAVFWIMGGDVFGYFVILITVTLKSW